MEKEKYIVHVSNVSVELSSKELEEIFSSEGVFCIYYPIDNYNLLTN